KVIFIYPMRSWLVEILYMEWPHGGTNWEYRVLEGGIKRHQSTDEYGQPEAAACDAFRWILDSDMAWKNGGAK
ncbi:MAG: hypothetical protein ABI970_26100, partial [Chloroflexota bacterium]